MEELLQAYFSFWSKAVPWSGSSTGYLPVFTRLTVPNGQVFPFLTYDITDYGMLQNGLDDVFLWTRTASLLQYSQFSNAIRQAIPQNGVVLRLDNNKGAVMLSRGTPFFQAYPQEDTAIKAGRALIQVNSYIY